MNGPLHVTHRSKYGCLISPDRTFENRNVPKADEKLKTFKKSKS